MKLLFLIPAALYAQVATLTTQATPPSPPAPTFFFSTFQNPLTSPASPTGGTLAIYSSTDATTFGTVGSTSYNCIANVRDPSIIHYAGKVLLGHTLTGSGGCVSTTQNIGLSSATDSLTGFAFGNETQYTCPLAGFCWAPEWFADPAQCTFTAGVGSGWSCASLANLHLYFANSTNMSCCSAFTLYEMHPTASDFITNTASWSTPVALTFASGTPTPIDPFMVCKNSSTGANCQNPAVANDAYYMFYNDKASTTGCLNYGTIPGLTGAITPVMTSNCLGFATYVEGPAVLHTVNGSPGTWRLYGDNYNNTYDQGQFNFQTSTDNWSTWVTDTFTLTPAQAKQGTIIPYP